MMVAAPTLHQGGGGVKDEPCPLRSEPEGGGIDDVAFDTDTAFGTINYRIETLGKGEAEGATATEGADYTAYSQDFSFVVTEHTGSLERILVEIISTCETTNLSTESWYFTIMP